MPKSIPCSIAWSHSWTVSESDVVADLSHDRHAARGLARHELVHALALVERERPELAHHAPQKMPSTPQPVDVAVDRGAECVLVDLPAVRRERSGDRDPEALDLLAGQLLRGRRRAHVHAVILANDCGTVAMHVRDADRTRARQERSARRVARGVPRSLRPDAAHPPVRGGDPAPVPQGRGARHDAPVRGPGGRRRRRLLGARARRLRRRHLPRPRPRARQGHGPRSARGRDARPRDRGLRRARGVHERDRPRARPRRLLRHRRRQHRAPPPAPAISAQRQGKRRGRVLRRRRDEPGVLPRVPELGRRSSTCRSCSSARTTSTASSRRWRASRPAATSRIRAAAFGMPVAGRRRQRPLGGATRPRWRRSNAPAAAAGRRCWSARPTATSATRSPTRRSTGPPSEVEHWLARDPLDADPRTAARPRPEQRRARGEGAPRSTRRWTARSRAHSAAPYPDPDSTPARSSTS